MRKKEINMDTIFLVIVIIVLVLSLGYAFMQINKMDKEIAYSQQMNDEKDQKINEILSFNSNNGVTDKTNELNKTIDELKEKVVKLEKQLEEKDKANSNEAKTSIKKIDESKDIVYTVKRNAVIYDEDQDKTIKIDIPQINLNCGNIIEFNKYLSEYDYTHDYPSVAYYINNNIISIKMHWQGMGDSEWNRIYNVNTDTGQFITLDDLLYMSGISREKFNSKIEKSKSEIIEKHLKPFESQDDYDVWKNFNESLNSEQNIRAFVNDKGILCAELLYTAPAGSGGPWSEFIEIK